MELKCYDRLLPKKFGYNKPLDRSFLLSIPRSHTQPASSVESPKVYNIYNLKLLLLGVAYFSYRYCLLRLLAESNTYLD